MFNEDVQLLVDGAHGQYIPQIFVQNYKNYILEKSVNADDLNILLEGPYAQYYWEAWDTVEQSAILQDDNGIRWTLYQDGDLWAVKEGTELPDQLQV